MKTVAAQYGLTSGQKYLKNKFSFFVYLKNISNAMLIERTDTEIIIRVPVTVDIEGIQELVDNLRYKEIKSKFIVSQTVIDKLAKQAKKNRWKKLRDKLMK